MHAVAYKSVIADIEDGREGSGFHVTLFLADGHHFTGAVWAPETLHYAGGGTVRIDPENDEGARVYVDIGAIVAIKLANPTG